MAEQKTGGLCENCKKQVVVFRKGTNHILHLILTLCTVGFWSLVWIGIAVKFGGWRCTECGSKKISGTI